VSALLRNARIFLASGLLTGALSAATDPAVDFQRQVRAILSENCFQCHGPDQKTRMANLRLDTRDGAFAARKNGLVIVPGKPDESLLVKRVFAETAAMRMPPVASHKTLTENQKNILRRWIEQGAQWKEHWAFIPPVRPDLPPVRNAGWVRNPIDRFVLAKLDSVGLQPASEADRHTLIRRVTLDLTGLPPAPAEVDAFVNDRSANAYEKVVERLLASPHYGEHRGRYWLDAARYGDTHGVHIDNYRDIWPYRDWVIRAFNGGMPFDRFTIDQLAGDLIPDATLEQKIASGFHRCNVTTGEGGSIEDEVAAMYAKDRADTTGTVWLGLTVGCATCHDHKYDPISAKDYYSLTAFFRNTTQKPLDLNLSDTPPHVLVPRFEERARWIELTREREALLQERAQVLSQSNAAAGFDEWLGTGERRSAAGDDSGEKLTRVPTEFGKDEVITLPHVAEIDADRPFTISTWVYLPRSKEKFVVASQFGPEPAENPKPSGERRTGWILEAGSGPGPFLALYGANGKYISAQPVENLNLAQESWHCFVFTFDGTRERRGFALYVDGKAVEVHGTRDDIFPLTTSVANDAPLRLGNDKKRYFTNGAIAEFRVIARRVDEQEAELLTARRAASAAARREAGLTREDREALLPYYLATREAAARLRRLDAERDAIARRASITLVMQERPDTRPVAHILYRGQYDAPREEVLANTPAVLPPMPASYPHDRLGLAKWLMDPANPLTARVTVNRFWQEVFGTGIVRTTEDFGSQGEQPVNPELLDWLAVEFRDSGWDVKKFFRLMVTSAAYRQSAGTTDEKVQRDPNNRLLSHGPRFRMDAEMVRDYALAASGLLNPEVGGESVKPYQPDNVWEVVAMKDSNTRFYTRDVGGKLYRRSMYTLWKRSAPPASMDIFNAPTREQCTVRRDRTNTPLQALVTMNDPQFVESARALAQHAMVQAHGNLDREIDFMAGQLLARRFEAREREVVAKSYRDYMTYYDSRPQDAAKLLSVGESKADASLPKAKFAALTMVANELLNLDEVLVK
jgi:mono/diheme cytochrome c family protein